MLFSEVVGVFLFLFLEGEGTAVGSDCSSFFSIY